MFNISEVKKDEQKKILKNENALELIKENNSAWIMIEVTSNEPIEKSFYTDICSKFDIIVLSGINEYKKVLFVSVKK